MSIAVGWTLSLSGLASEQIPVFDSLSSQTRADYPRLTAELESGELKSRAESALDSWQSSWRNQTIPWIVAGIVAFAVGLGWPKYDARRNGGASGTPRPPTSGPSAPRPSSAGGASSAPGAGTRLGRASTGFECWSENEHLPGNTEHRISALFYISPWTIAFTTICAALVTSEPSMVSGVSVGLVIVRIPEVPRIRDSSLRGCRRARTGRDHFV